MPVAHQRSQCRSQMRQRPVVTDRSTRSQRHEARQSRQQPRLEGHATTGGVHDLDDVLRSLRTPVRHLQMDQPDHQAAERGNANGRDHQQVGAGSHEPAAGRNEQPVVHQSDGVDEENGGKRCKRSGHESQNGHREKAHEESGFRRHQLLSGRMFMVTLDPSYVWNGLAAMLLSVFCKFLQIATGSVSCRPPHSRMRSFPPCVFATAANS